jgi:hypothetical protein
MGQYVRKECKECGVHTFHSQCGNCGSANLRRVAGGGVGRVQAERFARLSARRLSGVMARDRMVA